MKKLVVLLMLAALMFVEIPPLTCGFSPTSEPYASYSKARKVRRKKRIVRRKRKVRRVAPKPATPIQQPIAVQKAEADAQLAMLVGTYPILTGTTVEVSPTPNGSQAVAYYASGRILISPAHTASIARIMEHEVWHIIDFRDNGQIDWYENIPRATP